MIGQHGGPAGDVLEISLAAITGDSGGDAYIFNVGDGNDLAINLVGSDDKVSIQYWFNILSYQIEEIEVGDSVLLNSQVGQHVSAMAAYDVPAGVGNVIPQETKDALQPILTQSWQAA